MSEIIKTSFDPQLPEGKLMEAALRAIEENPANEPKDLSPQVSGLGAAVLTGKRWMPGRTLRILFMGGTDQQRDHVMNEVSKWLAFVNLKITVVTDPAAEIRISFANNGSWSYVGTDNLTVEHHQATMNFGFLDPGTVLHEFGHALSMIHEHSSPASGIIWNKEVVYRELGGMPNCWPPEMVDHNVFEKYLPTVTNFTEFDPDSIMIYAFPKRWTLNGYEVHRNTELSKLDKAFMAKVYPR